MIAGKNNNNGHTATVTREEFTLGQTDVSGNPKYFSRTNITAVGSVANNHIAKYQPIESVRTLAGKKATLTLYAKADATKDIVVEFAQLFGSGGSPSAMNSGIGITRLSLTTSWQRFDVVVDIPSISGKVIGTNNDDVLGVVIWMSADVSSMGSRNDDLGYQTGIFDIAHVSLVEGDATLEDDPFEVRHINQERDLCHRYCQIVGRGFIGRWNANTTAEVFGKYPELRVVPSVTFFTSSATIYRVGISAETATGLGFASLNLGTTGGQATITNGNLTSPSAGEVATLMTDCILLQSEL